MLDMRILLVTAMYPTVENPAFGSFVKTQVESLTNIGANIEVLVLSGRRRKLIYPRGVFQLRRRLRTEPFDVVHAHYSLVGMVARLQWRAPLVVTFHGDDLLGTIGPDGTHTRVSRIIAGAGRALCHFADGVIVQSKQMASHLKGLANIYIIPHEVDLDLFQPVDPSQARAELGLAVDKKYLLFAANPNIPVKNFPFAKAVFDRLRTEDASVELLVVHKETQKRLVLYMSACNALIFPSYQEGSPNVVKQAMACNLPIVASDAGDVREIVAPEDRCYVRPLEIESFAAAIRAILRRCERTDGRAHVAHLAGPLVARRVLQVYSDVVRKRALAACQSNAL
jgi:teichuronic acid biosynthesis glycosyltransferase TuaC